MTVKTSPIVVVGASAGGFRALRVLLRGLPIDFPAPVVVVLHRTPRQPSLLRSILARDTPLPVADAQGGDELRPGTVYVARPDQHVSITADYHFAYSDGRRIRSVLSSVNPLFASAAAVFGIRTIAVVLSGSGMDGTDGVQAVKANGGTVIVQDAATSAFFGMPGSAIHTGAVDYVLPLEEIAPALVRLVTEPPGTVRAFRGV